MWVVAVAAAVAAPSALAAPPVVQEFQPHWAPSGPSVPVAAGRVLAATVSPSSSDIAVVAAFSGGLFKTTNGGTTWKHLDGMPANRMWDVAFDPANANILIATVQVDTHVPSAVGIWRSADGGVTWTKPLGADPPPSTCTSPRGRDISFGPDQNLFVATDCGISMSHDGGVTWQLAIGVPQAWSVIAQPGAGYPANPNAVVVYACGGGGVFRSVDNGQTWGTMTASPGFGTGLCSLAASPFETNVLFGTAGSSVWESDDSGATWTQLFTLTNPGRRSFVRTNVSAASASNFELYFNPGADLKRTTCASTGPGLRCPGTFVAGFAGHHDPGDIAFGTTAPSLNCPLYETNDGGAYRSFDCGSTWTGVFEGLGALQIYDMAGTKHAGVTGVIARHIDLYIGTMDNEIWGSGNTGASWPNHIAAEGFNIQAPHSSALHGQTVTGTRCFPCSNFSSNDHLAAGASAWTNPPGGSGNPFLVSRGRWAQVSGNAIFVGSSGSWGVSAALPGTPTYELFIGGSVAYDVQTLSSGNDGLIRIAGLNGSTLTVSPGDAGPGDVDFWVPDDAPFVNPHVVGVDPANPDHLIAADRASQTMMLTRNGGATWQTDRTLTSLVTDRGKLVFRDPFTGAQAHAIGFDPENAKHILVGTEASGIIGSIDGGASWFRVPGSRAIFEVSDFYFNGDDVFVSTYGRGLWRLDLAAVPSTDLAVTAAAAPDPVTVGNALTYSLKVKNNGATFATDLLFTDTLPTGITATSASSTHGPCSIAVDKVTCTMVALGSGSAADVTITGFSTQSGIVLLTNRAEISSSTLDKTQANNTTTTTTALAPAVFSAAQAPSPDPVAVGDDLAYTITIRNSGYAGSTDVSFVDDLPIGAIPASVSSTQGSCVTAGAVTCALGSLARSASATVTIVVTPTIPLTPAQPPNPPLPGMLTNTVRVWQSPQGLLAGTWAFRSAVSGAACTRIGTQQPDSLVGTAGNDVICGLGGDDVVSALDGSDTIAGGSGNDVLNGGEATDTESGGAGNDRFDEGPTANGFDTLAGGEGRDTADYGLRPQPLRVTLDDQPNDGDSTIGSPVSPFSEGDDVRSDVENIVGGARNDFLTGDAHPNGLYGSGGDDVLEGGAGADLLDGGPDADTLNDGPGSDRDVGGLGDDVIVQWPGADDEDGGPGFDTASYFGRQGPLVVKLDGRRGDGAVGERDNVRPSIEKVVGSFGDDMLTGNARVDNVLEGTGGSDRLSGLGGNDELKGGGQDDVEDGGSGNDTFQQDEAIEGADMLLGGSGIDTVNYGNRFRPLSVIIDGAPNDGEGGEGDNVQLDVENINGGSGADRIAGSAEPNRIAGGNGPDRLFGLDGDDVFAEGSASNGRDLLVGGNGVDTADYGLRAAEVQLSLDGQRNDGEAFEDDLVEVDVENLIGGSGPDLLVGSADPNSIFGGVESDRLFGLAGADKLDGGSGADTVDGGPDVDNCVPDPADTFTDCP